MDGKAYNAEVGSPHGLNGEPVVAVLHEPQRSLYHVCTTNRGVVRGRIHPRRGRLCQIRRGL